jgi:hypothetical protein
MDTRFPGLIRNFPSAKVGDFFMFFDGDDEPSFAMKVTDPGSGSEDLLSFSHPAHPTMTAPTILNGDQFLKKDVMVITGAVLRAASPLTSFRPGVPHGNDPGVVIFVPGAVCIRAWQGQGTVYINIGNGEAIDSRAHAGSMWCDAWEIVQLGDNKETILCSRGKPKASA